MNLATHMHLRIEEFYYRSDKSKNMIFLVDSHLSDSLISARNIRLFRSKTKHGIFSGVIEGFLLRLYSSSLK